MSNRLHKLTIPTSAQPLEKRDIEASIAGLETIAIRKDVPSHVAHRILVSAAKMRTALSAGDPNGLRKALSEAQSVADELASSEQVTKAFRRAFARPVVA